LWHLIFVLLRLRGRLRGEPYTVKSGQNSAAPARTVNSRVSVPPKVPARKKTSPDTVAGNLPLGSISFSLAFSVEGGF
jgi:hypothetical protein